jgi:hypothetical protein
LRLALQGRYRAAMTVHPLPDGTGTLPKAAGRGIRRAALALTLASAAAACAPTLPGRPRPISDEGPAPVILPLDSVLAQTDLPGLEPTDTEALQARAAGLQARGAELAAVEADPETRARLDAALEPAEP